MAIKISELTKKFGDKTAVDGISLDIDENQCFGLLGVNGAGKTTTIKMLCLQLSPTSGEADIFGKSISSKSVKDIEFIKSSINVSPQETAVAPNLTVSENLMLMAGLYGVEKNEAIRRTERIVADFQLDEILNQRTKTLSGGWQRRLSIAMGLMSEPKILFLDEPTLGLDVIARRELWRHIEELKKSMTVVLTTHYLEEAEALCDRIAIMVGGKLKALGTAQELKSLAGTDSFEEAFVHIAEGEVKADE